MRNIPMPEIDSAMENVSLCYFLYGKKFFLVGRIFAKKSPLSVARSSDQSLVGRKEESGGHAHAHTHAHAYTYAISCREKRRELELRAKCYQIWNYNTGPHDDIE